jgi:hypothetical protein
MLIPVDCDKLWIYNVLLIPVFLSGRQWLLELQLFWFLSGQLPSLGSAWHSSSVADSFRLFFILGFLSLELHEWDEIHGKWRASVKVWNLLQQTKRKETELLLVKRGSDRGLPVKWLGLGFFFFSPIYSDVAKSLW